VSKVLSSAEPQSVFFSRYGGWLVVPFAFVIGWPLKNLLFIILKWFGLTKQVPWSGEVLFQHLLFAGILGFLPSLWLLARAAGAYPSVEIQAGPSRFWREARQRSRLRIILGVAIIAPSANFLYDIYGPFFSELNQTMELTASRRTAKLPMTLTFSPAAKRALARGSSSCSR